MSKRNKENVYRTEGDITYIDMTSSKGIVRTAIIDTEDLEKVKSFYKFFAYYAKHTDTYYVKAHTYLGMVDGKPKYKDLSLQRFVMDAQEDEIIDHYNHDTLDNRKENLRRTKTIHNTKHRNGKNKNNKSGYRNVAWIKNGWCVQISIEGKNTLLGKFEDVHEAGKFAKKMREKYYGEFAGED